VLLFRTALVHFSMASLAKKLKRNICKLAKRARASSARNKNALALLSRDPQDAKRTAAQREIIRKYLGRIPYFRKIPKNLFLDFCTYAVTTEYGKGDIVVELGEEAVFVLVLHGKANVMKRTNTRVPAKVLFEGDCENETYLDQLIPSSQNSPVTIVAAKAGTVVLRMSQAWLQATDFLRICRVVGIELREQSYSKTTFFGRLPPRNLERVLRRCRIQNFSAYKTLLEASVDQHKAVDDDVVASADSHIDNVLYIAEGVVQVKWVFQDGATTWYVPVATFAEGEVVGLLEVLYNLPVSYQVVAMTSVKTVLIPKDALSYIPTKDVRQSEEVCFNMWLSWVNGFLKVLQSSTTDGQVCALRFRLQYCGDHSFP